MIALNEDRWNRGKRWQLSYELFTDDRNHKAVIRTILMIRL